MRVEPRRGELEGLDEFAPHPLFKALAGQHLKSFAQQDESGIGVFSSCSGLCFKGQIEAGAQKACRCRFFAEEFNIAEQAGVVGQQMAETHFARTPARRAPDDKSR